MENKIYETIIVGAGPAGLTASIYASRYMVDHLVIGHLPGGMASEATEIHNWPGDKAINGYDLAQRMIEHAKGLGAEIIGDTVVDIKKEQEIFKVITQGQKEFQAKTVILALGTERRKLNIPGEKEFFGKGVCYCATCDGPLYRNKTIAIVGGGNAGVGAAIYLSNLVNKLYLITNEKELRAETKLHELIYNNPKIEVILENGIKELKGDQKLSSMVLDKEHNGQAEIAIEGIFVEIGGIPPKELLEKINIETDQKGYIKINPDCSTNIEGLFAAGDITNGNNGFRQIVTAAASGAIAQNSVYNYLRKK